LKLPNDITAGLNRSVSRHDHPEDLDWSLVAGQWIALDNDRCFVILHDTQFGYVVAEKKSAAYHLGAETN
jgi:hypothetical protein